MGAQKRFLKGISRGFKTRPKPTQRTIEQHTFDEFFDSLRLHRVLRIPGRVFGLVLAALFPSLSILSVPPVLVDQRYNQLLRFLHRFGSVEATDIHELKHTIRLYTINIILLLLRLFANLANVSIQLTLLVLSLRLQLKNLALPLSRIWPCSVFY